jgi:two-component system nitrogen regulation response regulator GlnG
VVLSEALRRAGGNQVKAAALLGLHRNTLRRRMEETGLAKPKADDTPDDAADA